MGAYFLLFRKTPLAIKFVRDWLTAMSDPMVSRVESLTGAPDPGSGGDVAAREQAMAQLAASGMLNVQTIPSDLQQGPTVAVGAAAGFRTPIKNSAGFQKHMADQSALSILFKHYGFKWMVLREVHQLMALKRWRD